jgi:hypothetical protein
VTNAIDHSNPTTTAINAAGATKLGHRAGYRFNLGPNHAGEVLPGKWQFDQHIAFTLGSYPIREPDERRGQPLLNRIGAEFLRCRPGIDQLGRNELWRWR